MAKKTKARVNRMLRPFVLALIEKLHKKKYNLHYKNRVAIPSTPAIFAFTHISGDDTMVATEVVRKPAHILIASDPLTALLKLPLTLLGMVQVNRTDKTKASQRKAMEEMAALLEQGSHIIIFPEAVWNVKPNRLVLPLHWGIVELAQKTGCPIIPVALLKVASGDYYINMGPPLHLNKEGCKADATEELYGILGDLTGQMVFDTQIQASIPRNEFSPEAEYNKKLQSGFGFIWDAQYEGQFIQRNTIHAVDPILLDG